MDIKEKMELCFNDELLNNEVLTLNEKKVLASLLYSYKICKEAKDCNVIRSIEALRKDVRINTNAMYDAIRNLENLYQMIERRPGKSRVEGEQSIASLWTLHFDKIFNPPKEAKKFSFLEELKSLEKPINTVDIDTNIDTDIDINIDTDMNVNAMQEAIESKELIADEVEVFKEEQMQIEDKASVAKQKKVETEEEVRERINMQFRAYKELLMQSNK